MDMRAMRSGTIRLTPAVLVMLAGTALAGPEGERVVAGQASFDRAGTTTTITAGHNAIIEYGSFDIGANEAVRFVQPSSDARVLNRVLGQSPTQISGSLSANGQVYIVNEAGVYFGRTALVNAGAIYAGAGTITNRDFAAGVDRLTGIGGEVRNDGVINAAEIHLAGRRVTNLGELAATDVVTMTAGDEVYIGERDGHVFVQAKGLGGTGAVDQAGTVRAPSVRLGSGDLFSVALRPTSVIQGRDVRIEGRGSGVVQVNGAIDVSSADGVGGLAAITGEGVAVLDATIDASGALGGGNVLIGGGFRGDTSVIETSDKVYVSPGATLRADALDAGDGGTVVTWADRAAIFEGRVSVRGGAAAGNGGRAEVSSPRFVSVGGAFDGAAPNGSRGSLLIDPDTISITDANANTNNDDLLDDNQIPIDEAAGMDVVITGDRLETIGDVDVLLEAAEDIRIAQIADGSLDLPQTAGQTVTLSAGRDIVVGEGTDITTQGGSLSLTGGNSVTVGSIDARGGTVSLVSDGSVSSFGTLESAGGVLSFSVLGGDRTASIKNAEASGFVFDVDAIDLSGNLLADGPLDLAGLPSIVVSDPEAGATIGAIDGTETFDITFDPAVSISGPGALRFVGRDITLPAVNGLSRLEVSATGLLTLSGDIRMDNRDDGFGGLVDLRDASAIALDGDRLIDTDLPGDAVAGDVLLDGTAIESDTARLTIDTNNDNVTVAGDNLGRISLGDTSLRGLTLFGGVTELRGDIAVTESLDLGRVASVRIEGPASLATNGADLSFGSNSINGSASLSIDLLGTGSTAGALDLTEAVGAVDPLESLEISGGAFGVPEVTTLGDQTYTSTGLVRLDGDLETTGSGSVFFNSSMFFDADRAITTGGGEGNDVVFLGNVRGNDASLTTNTGLGSTVFDRMVNVVSLATNGSTELRGATVSAEESLVLGEDSGRDTVMLTQRESLVRNRTGDVVFRSSVQGGQTLRVAADPTAAGNDIPVIVFESSVGDQTALESLVLGEPDAAFFGGTRTDVPAVATVVVGQFDADGNPVPGLAFEFVTDGDFVMNPLEKLTALGSIAVTAGGTAQIGDVTTPGNLSITASDILTNSRAGADLVTINRDLDPPALLPEDATTDFGTDFVVGGSASFSGPVRLSDPSLADPTLAEPAGEVRVENILTRAPQSPITLEDLAFNRRTGAGPTADRTTVLDAVATGAVTVPLAEGLTPEATERFVVLTRSEEQAAPNVAEASSASAAGVGVRAPTGDEYLALASGVAIYVDTPASLAQTRDLRVVSARLSPEDANAFTEAWARLASAVNEPARDADRVLARVRSTLSIAAEQYETRAGESIEDADAFELFASIREAQADTSRALQLVGTVLASVRGLGLSEAETARIETSIIDGIRPDGLGRSAVRNLVESAVDSR
ncbi:MAG: filamentous hemagglutinin N-terminal domain-containing protein [Planctomycetota bacterium]